MKGKKAAQRPLMPRPAADSLPTPASSTDIEAQSNKNAVLFDVLPPSALGSAARGSSTSSALRNVSDSSYRPLSPTSPTASAKGAPALRKRAHSSTLAKEKDDYKLPPPPTRSRRIIQMNPPKQESQTPTKAQAAAATNAKTTTGENGTKSGAKRKQPNSTTTASKKSARKTAHSLIERRRRSKMNEEFGVLKDMIPACHGQDMHKLAILQASIEYTRYLEKCIAELTASRSRADTPVPYPPRNHPSNRELNDTGGEDDDEDNSDEGEEEEAMSDLASPTEVPKRPTTFQFTHTSSTDYRSDRSVHSTTTSPNVGPLDMRHYSETFSPALQASDRRHYSFASSVHSAASTPSLHPSPAFVAQTQQRPPSSQWSPASASRHGPLPGPPTFTLTSPALKPQADREDHEATEALLMLNADRRGSKGSNTIRGMSVKDLLS